MIFHLVCFLIQELPAAVRRLLDPVPSHEERGAENMLYLAEHSDTPDLPIPLLSEEQARAMAEADAQVAIQRAGGLTQWKARAARGVTGSSGWAR